MKTRIILLMMLTLSSYHCSSQKPNDLTKENIKGRVSVLMESYYTATEQFGKIQSQTLRRGMNFKYNANGNLIEESSYNAGNSPRIRSNFEYDEKGRLIVRNDFLDSSDEGLTYKNIYNYNEKGNPIEQVTYFADGRFHSKYAKTYDDVGRQTEEIRYNYSQESNGIKYEFKYNDNGEINEKNVYDSDGLITKSLYKYDNIGNKLEEIRYNSDGSLDAKFTYKYDRYDSTGNWLRKIEFINGKLIWVTEREIEYYY